MNEIGLLEIISGWGTRQLTNSIYYINIGGDDIY